MDFSQLDCPQEAFIDFIRAAEHAKVAAPPQNTPEPAPATNFNPHSGSAPHFAPPDYMPDAGLALHNADPAAIRRCLYNNSYFWLNNSQQFWFFPTFIGQNSIAGFRRLNNNWVYMGFGLNMVDYFYCSGR
ncbi:MAG: hypothetical protein LBE35_10260 [Clostridiales bacterium]|nr:hypothetical protein [Clostridiales bacterium]